MSTYQIDDIFSKKQLKHIKSIIDNTDIPMVNGEYVAFDQNNGTGVHAGLGRVQINNIMPSLTEDIIQQLYQVAERFTEIPLAMDHATYVEYNAKYGQPNLPPHFDGDTNDLIINYQLESNTVWELGLDLQTFRLADNSALVFNANTQVHWRTHKDFKPDEYVKMIFIRFYNSEERSDYSHMRYSQDHEIFKEALDIRDSLKSNGI
jgi:hypothetical protein